MYKRIIMLICVILDEKVSSDITALLSCHNRHNMKEKVSTIY